MSDKSETLRKLNVPDTQLLYGSLPLNFLYEHIEMLISFLNCKNLPERKKDILSFDIIIKYCQLMESFAGFINTFEDSNKQSLDTNSTLKRLSEYSLKQIQEDFKPLSDESITEQKRSKFYEKIKYAFCFDMVANVQEMDKSIKKIFGLLINFFSVYYTYLKVYNAYKHGHRIYYIYDNDSNKGTGVIYLEQVKSANDPVINPIPVDEEIINKIWEILTRDFIPLYDLFDKNNYALFEKRISDIKFT
jgi:hypothetical protein